MKELVQMESRGSAVESFVGGEEERMQAGGKKMRAGNAAK